MGKSGEYEIIVEKVSSIFVTDICFFCLSSVCCFLHFSLMIFRILSVSIFSLFCFTPYFSYAASPVCIQKIQYAQNQNTGECQAFSTPCDVPSGWASVDECSLTQSSQKITPPKFQIQKFSSCQDMESRLVDILKRYQSDYWYPSPLYARA